MYNPLIDILAITGTGFTLAIYAIIMTKLENRKVKK